MESEVDIDLTIPGQPDENERGCHFAEKTHKKAKRLAITRIERCANSSAETDITLGQESLRSWKFELAPTVPMLDAPLSLAASCERASAFSAKFSLPAGRDYAFCVPEGQSPVVPVCVALAREET